MGGRQQDGYPSVPPLPSGGSAGQKWRVYSPPAKMTRQGPTTYHVTRGEGRGKTRHFSKYSLIKGYFKRPISQNLSAKLAPSLLECQSLPVSFLWAVRRENLPYIATQAYIRPAKTTSHSQSATLHSTGNISAKGSEHQEQSRPQQHTLTVSSLLFFPLKSTAAHRIHIQHLYVDWGYRFKTPIVKEAFR